MSQRKKKLNKRNFRTKLKEVALPDNNNTFLAETTKALGNCRFMVVIKRDGTEVFAKLSTSLAGGYRRNRIRIGDLVLVEEEAFSLCKKKDPTIKTKRNLKIVGKYTQADRKRLRAVNAFDSYTTQDEEGAEASKEAAFVFEGEDTEKTVSGETAFSLDDILGL